MITLLAVVALAFLLIIVSIASRRPKHLHAGTVPGSFPGLSTMEPGQIAVSNKLGNTGAFGSTVFFRAPVAGWYSLGWGVHINSTDNAGTITFTVLPPNSVAIPGVQAAPATPSDGKGPFAPYYMAQGATVTGSVAVGSLTGTNFDCWVFAQKLDN